jgi:hypothetical protein
MLQPTNDQFIKIALADDIVVLSIRGHIAIDSALSDVILQALPNPHLLEVERLSFLLKFDLAVALKSMNKNSRPLFQKLNAIRNQFAHQAAAELNDTAAQELKNCMTELHKKIVKHTFETAKKPRDILEIATAAAFYEANYAHESLVNRKLERDAVREETEILLKETEQYSNHPATGEFGKRVKSRLEAKQKSLREK